ncbi:helix-turn-helix domain-containing protein [Cytobacillus oceanisediminis]|uniref:helix-turn-helix domain-containing protein n=1 Tax=Cytobacillus oceanisediminis TaxID=665099 RepID=UPI001CCD16A5|nr:helix-turn-helix domain-containing protein [Cytobacillus oceanisediminis]MBZ9536669.1 helix-turn-helix domain-containing protein [Cytobacillus oceanisediminis]
MNQVVTDTQAIFEQGNLQMKFKLKFFGKSSQLVIKYIMGKLRKYHGEFFESNSTIAEAIGVSVRTVQLAVKRAEQLNIFVVSSRFEATFNSERMRQTSNKIQLLVYDSSMQVVKKVVEKVRKVKSILVEKVQTASKKVSKPNTKKEYKQPKQQPKKVYNSANKKPIRTEKIPEFFKQPEYPTGESNKEYSNSEIETKIESLKQRIKAL